MNPSFDLNSSYVFNSRQQASSAAASAASISEPDTPTSLPLFPQNKAGYNIQRHVNKGTFGAVSIALVAGTTQQVAIKQSNILSKDGLLFIFNMTNQAAEHEERILGRLDSNRIVKYYTGFFVDKQRWTVLEAFSGDISMQIFNKSIENIWRVADAMLDALDYLKQRGVVHRDIKPENIFFDSNRIVLGDFGMAHSVEDPILANSLRGTIDYTAPELALHTVVNEEEPELIEYFQKNYQRAAQPPVDMWALGVVLLNLYTQKTPFRFDTKDMSKVEQQIKIIENVVRYCGPIPKHEWNRSYLDLRAGNKELQQRFTEPAEPPKLGFFYTGKQVRKEARDGNIENLIGRMLTPCAESRLKPEKWKAEQTTIESGIAILMRDS